MSPIIDRCHIYFSTFVVISIAEMFIHMLRLGLVSIENLSTIEGSATKTSIEKELFSSDFFHTKLSSFFTKYFLKIRNNS